MAFFDTKFKTYIFAALCCMAASGVSAQGYIDNQDSLYRMLQEVDVVAVKQGSNIFQQPVSGNLINSSVIERDRINDIKGVSGMVPNFFIPDYGSRITSSIYVRGIGARMDQPAVGLNIDNVGILNKDAYDFELMDIASIEMIRGPQASLFGRNTMTGLITVKTLSPLEFQGWRLGMSYSSGNTVKINAGWYKMFSPTTGFSISTGFTHSDGRFINQHDGQKIDRENSGAMRTKLYWSPSGKFTLTNVLSSSLLAQGGYPYEYGATGLISYNDTCFYRRFLLTDGLTLKGRVGNAELISVTSLQHLHDNMTLDQDFLPDPFFTLTQRKNETSFTEDLLFRGNTLHGHYRWLAGVYGFYRHLKMLAPVTFLDSGISSLIESYRNSANPYHPILWHGRDFVLNSDFTLPSGGAAVYHESALTAGKWTLTAGLRLDYERVDLRYHSFCNTGYDIYYNPTGELPLPPGVQLERKVDVNLNEYGRLHRHYLMLLPKVTALWEIPGLNSSNLYASIGSGYKAGGFNTQMFSDVLQQRLMGYMGIGASYNVDDIVGYKPEKSWTFELGAHFSSKDNHIRGEVALFAILCRDQQLTTFPDGTTTGRMMTNAGRTRSLGGEISLNWSPVSALTVVCNYGFTDARFTDYDNGMTNYKGKRLPYAPSNTLYLSGSYTFTGEWLRNNAVEVGAGFYGVGNIYWNEANDRVQPFYGQLSVNLLFRARKWSVELWGNNMTDTKFRTFYFLSMKNEFYQRGMPRTLGVTLSAHI